MTSAPPTPSHPRRTIRRQLPLIIYGALAAGIVVAGVLLALSTRDAARRRGGADLDAVAVLKAQGITAWRADALADVVSTAGSAAVIEAAAHADRPPEDVADRARSALAQLVRHRALTFAALVVAPDLVTVGAAGAGPPPDPALVRRALAEGAASALVAEYGEGSPRLDLAAAIPVSGPPTVFYARMDARASLVRITSGWPVPSETGEAALARADGDAAFFVTDPRFLPGWAFRERIPFVEGDRGLARAVRREGVFEAVDYRHTRMLAASRRVPDSDLFMVTRMDLAELEAPLVRPLRWVGGLVGLLLLAAGLALGWSHREERLHLAALSTAQREIEAGRKRLELALAGNHWVWEWDLEAGVLSADPGWAARVGLPYHSVRGDPAGILSRIVHPDDRPHVQERLEAHVRGRADRFEAEFRTRLPTGERWIRFRAGATERGPDGLPRRLLGVLSDITDERTLQAQLERSERMASLGTLAAGAAHEINNPLTYVLSNLDVLERGLGAARPEFAEAVRQAREGTERVREVVRGLRSFSRSGSARGAVNVAEELEAAVRIARNVIQHRATLDVHIGPTPSVDARGRELGQVFLNLLVNAGQAIPEGGGRGHVRVDARTDADGQACIEIVDDGVGIAPEVLPRIFEPFFTTKPLGVGTGLGLSIAHNVVTAAGGTIQVESQLGVGSTFRVLLPPARPRPAGVADVELEGEVTGEHELRPPRARPSPAPETPPAPPAPDARPDAAARPAVLVVDDEPLVARSIARAIQAEATVTVAPSAEEARRLLEAGQPFAAVVCDLMMPGMTGMDLHEWVTERDPALARRFVFVTGGAFTERSRQFLEGATVAFVEKPFEPGKLREAVRAAVAGTP